MFSRINLMMLDSQPVDVELAVGIILRAPAHHARVMWWIDRFKTVFEHGVHF